MQPSLTRTPFGLLLVWKGLQASKQVTPLLCSEEAPQTPLRHTFTTASVRTLYLVCSLSCCCQLQKKSGHKRQAFRPVGIFLPYWHRSRRGSLRSLPCPGWLGIRPAVWVSCSSSGGLGFSTCVEMVRKPKVLLLMAAEEAGLPSTEPRGRGRGVQCWPLGQNQECALLETQAHLAFTLFTAGERLRPRVNQG